MKLYRKIYNRSPIIIQNFMTSVYGYKIHNLRYGGKFQNYYDFLEESQWFATEKLYDLRMTKLKDLLTHAYQQTKYYREIFDEAGFNPRNFTEMTDLKNLPILTKEDIINNCERMVAGNYRDERLIKHFTSGTTGTPMMFYLTKDVYRCNYAHWMRFREWFGFERWAPRATISGRIVVPRSQNKPPFWRYNVVENQTVFSSFHISEENLPYYIEKLRKSSFTLIDGYVSSIYAIARYLNKLKIDTVRPLAVQTTSETLLKSQRREIEKAFGCKVYDQYGHGECAVFVCECEKGRMHINDEYGIVEILKEGKPVGTGESGEIVVTGLVNWAMPFIRYRTGDIGVKGDDKQCECGRGLSLLEAVEGRVVDTLKMPDGKIIPPVTLKILFDKAENIGIKESQIIQISANKVVVNLVLDDDEKDLNPLLSDLRSVMGDEIEIKFNRMNSIPRTETGKFRFVISNIAHHI